MSRRTVFVIALCVVAIFLIVFGAFKIIDGFIQAKRINDEVKQQYVWHSRIEQKPYEKMTLDGKNYSYRGGLINVLLLGVDKEGEMAFTKTGERAGQSDAIYLITIDKINLTVDIVQLDRDTMTEINITGIDKKVVGTRVDHLCLSYAYGDGGSRSCEYAAAAVSNLLGGIPIDYVASLTMSAIAPLVDAIGGVTMYIETDMSDKDPALVAGQTVTLTGEQAYTYIRARMGVDDGRNESRMKRQRAFVDALKNTVMEKLKADITDATAWYDAIAPYTYLDHSFDSFLSLFDQSAHCTWHETITPEGEHDYSKTYAEFYIDKDKLDVLRAGLWYKEDK